MKIIKATIAMALCVVVMVAGATVAFANDTPSPWAQEQVNVAIAENLVPENLRFNYTQAITRAEFCALATRLYETIRGEITGRLSFADTNDINVEKMAYLGVVSGVGDDRFDPNGTLTREQAAVILSRLSDAIDRPFPSIRPSATVPFADRGSIASWAYESVFRVQVAGIMSGVGDNRFAPQDPYTREQSIVTIVRMFEFMSITGIPGAPPLELPPLADPGPADDPSSGPDMPYVIGEVRIMSNGVEHEPHEHFLHGVILREGGFLSGGGLPFSLEEVSELLTEIEYTDDFQVIIDGDDARSVGFSLYDDNFDVIYTNNDSFLSPDETGVYILYVDVVWSNLDDDSEPREFTMIRYIFKIRVP